MVKAKREKGFTPVTLTLETKEEFDFLLGLLLGGADRRKMDCPYFSRSLDDKMYDVLEEFE